MDKEPSTEGDDSRAVLASWLDDYISGRCERTDMQASFLTVCKSNPDAPWDALALLDQYQRRGRIDVHLARTLKAEIAQLVFGVPNQTEQPLDTEATLDTTGSRWRKLYEERAPHGINADHSFDPTANRREHEPLARDPLTRPPPAQPDEAAARGTLRQRYDLISVLGRGTSGTVYKALDRHRAHLPEASRFVAIKVLKLNYEDRAEQLAQLEQEFCEAQSLAHPNIATVFDLDRDGSTWFVVMELLEGELLAEVLRKLDGQPMARENAFAIVSAIGAALAYAHRRDIVHADLKPRNVMITSSGEVRVLEFGFARHRPLGPSIMEGTLDLAGVAQPEYASLERVHGNEPQPSDDVYSLACIAYELLAGVHPFGGRSAVLARAHGRAPARIGGLTGKQWHALEQALHWNRGERRLDLAEFLAALGCAGAPQRLTPPHTIFEKVGSRTPEWLRRAGVVALFAAVAVAGFFAMRDFEMSTSTPPAAAVLPQDPQPDTVVVDAPPPEQAAVEHVEAPPVATVESRPQPPTSSAPSQTARAEPPAAASPAAAANERPQPANAGARAGVISFDKDNYVSTESDGSVRLTVRRTGSVRQADSFRWLLKGNSAGAGTDFAAIGPAIETFPAGVRSIDLIIPLVSDALVESTEVFLVELERTQGGAELGELSRAAVIIVDDD